MNRRRPLPRSNYQYLAKAKPSNVLRYELILDGAVRKYPDGREVCQDNAAGWREYKRRIEVMVQRQSYRCCLCGKRLALSDATFEHSRRRGMGAAWREDRIYNEQGEMVNGAAHWICNAEKG